MITSIPLLQDVRVASPCNASWDEMAAIDGERVKFCSGCKKNVYNLSAMSQGEAEGLLRRHEGRLCVRYYQRGDGTVLSGDCSVGAQAIRMALVRRSVVAAGLFAMLFGAMAAVNIRETQPIALPLTGATAMTVEATPSAPELTVNPEPPVIEQPAPTPEVRVHPTMGMAVRWTPVPPAKAQMDIVGKVSIEPPLQVHQGRTIVGHIPRSDDGDGVIGTVPDQPRDYQYATPEKDSTDESIVKPHND